MAFFDPSEIKDDGDLIPVGEYQTVIENIGLKRNSQGTGDLIKGNLLVTSDFCQGRKIFFNFNFNHDNSQAQEIGRKEFARMIKATFGEPKAIEELEELLGKAVGVRVSHKKDKSGEMRENVKYMPVDQVKEIEDAPF
jgi:hypothetical protein